MYIVTVISKVHARSDDFSTEYDADSVPVGVDEPRVGLEDQALLVFVTLLYPKKLTYIESVKFISPQNKNHTLVS